VILLRACALPGADFLVLGSDGAFTPPLSTAALMEFLSQRCGGDHGRAHAGGPLGTLSPPLVCDRQAGPRGCPSPKSVPKADFGVGNNDFRKLFKKNLIYCSEIRTVFHGFGG